MGLADKFSNLTPSPTGLPCGMAKLMDSMTEDDRTVLNKVLFNEPSISGKRISNSKIYEILREEGHNVAVSSIAQHRRKQCRCFVGAAARQEKVAK